MTVRNLPQDGKHGLSTRELKRLADAGDIVIILTDDVDFGANSTFGGPIPCNG